MDIISFKNKKDLIEQYSYSHRSYHDLSHITSMFEVATMHGLTLTDIQRLAIWYHDVVYFPTKKNNELASVDYFRLMNNDLANHIKEKVTTMILASALHKSNDEETQIFLDLDLHILGDDLDTYLDASTKIREEYHHLSNERWKIGRSRFLKEMLSRSFIFNTRLFRDCYEDQARFNITYEMNNL